MTIAAKHGFRFIPIPPTHEQIYAFAARHFLEHRLPLNSPIRGVKWYAVVRKDQDVERIYGVLGLAPAFAGAEVSDLYVVPGRWGVLASYAALEKLKGDADASGIPLVTATPTDNQAMIRAHQRVFGDEDRPVLMVYRYAPKVSERAAEHDTIGQKVEVA